MNKGVIVTSPVNGQQVSDQPEQPITVFLLDDHEVVRRGVRDLLEAEPDIEVVGEAGTVSSALARIPALRLDVAVLDVRLPDAVGVSVGREIRARRAEGGGAVGPVGAGQSRLDPRAASQLMARLRDVSARKDPLAGLSGQERRILELIGEGLTNRQIGERMFLAEKTVKNYVSALFAKLGMERRTQAAAFAARTFGDQHDHQDPVEV